MYPLLCGLLSELEPWCGTLFWDTYGDWLLHKVNHPVPSLDSPRIGPAAHRADIKALKFATRKSHGEGTNENEKEIEREERENGGGGQIVFHIMPR